jgi:hypothetical protein
MLSGISSVARSPWRFQPPNVREHARGCAGEPTGTTTAKRIRHAVPAAETVPQLLSATLVLVAVRSLRPLVAGLKRLRYGDITQFGDPNLEDPNANQQLVLMGFMLRDQALRHNPALRELFERPRKGIGRGGVDWN